MSAAPIPLQRLITFAAVLADLALASAVGAEGAPAVKGALSHLALRSRHLLAPAARPA